MMKPSDAAVQQETDEALSLLDNDLDNIEVTLTEDNTARGAAVASARVLIALARFGSRVFRTVNANLED